MKHSIKLEVLLSECLTTTFSFFLDVKNVLFFVLLYIFVLL